MLGDVLSLVPGQFDGLFQRGSDDIHCGDLPREAGSVCRTRIDLKVRFSALKL
jgi:hypothetical protein